MTNRAVVTRRIVDGIIVVIVIIFTCLSVAGLLPRVRRGFTCNDSSISKPFSGDTISAGQLFGFIFLVPTIVFAATEAIHTKTYKLKSLFSKCVSKCGHLLGDFLIGFLYTLALTELIKNVVGELRPHFIDSCRPDWSHINCSERIVNKYNCTGTGPRWLVESDIYKSFPSGHASLSFYTATFMCLYTHERIHRSSYSHLLRSWIQFLFVCWSAICSFTRITDNRHFWWDVATGAVIGAIAGYYAAKCFMKVRFATFAAPEEQDEIAITDRKHVQDLHQGCTRLSDSEP